MDDRVAEVKARHDYLPFGEEASSGVGSRTVSQGYTVDKVRQKFTAKERDIETELDYFLARYYAFSQGRFTTPDDFRNDTGPDDPQSWNLYVYGRNSPLIFVDATGTMTDFVDNQTGEITNINDGKDQVIATTTGVIAWLVREARSGTPAYGVALGAVEKDNVANLHMTRQQFTARAATTYAESSFPWTPAGSELANEMKAIAWVNTRNNVAFGANSLDAKRYKSTAFGSQDAKMKLANLAIVNQVQGGPDTSNGAVAWDGMEQAQYPGTDKRAHIPNPNGPGTWQLHQNTIGWSISNADYAKWRQNVGKSFRAPQVSTTSSGKIGYYSTAVWGRTISWRR